MKDQASSDALLRVLRAYRTPAVLAGRAPDTPLLLGLSGGADSRLLLHLLTKECKESGSPLSLAHLHHGIRGEEADRDEQFCRDLAAEYGLPLYVEHVDVPALARERGESLETVARDVRYAFFSRVMREQSIPVLLTAHNADDNLETVLFHLVRGCATRGLSGIAPVRPLDTPGQTVVRPLLLCSKEDIVAACHHLGLAFVTDSTNQDTSYTRNFLRAHVLPALSQITPHPEWQVSRVSEALREDEECLECYAEVLMDNRALTDQMLKRSVLASAHPALAKRVLRRWVEQQSGQTLAACHLEALLALCAPDATSKQLCLPGGVVIAERDCLRWKSSHKENREPLDFDLPLSLGEQVYEDLGFRLTVTAHKGNIHQTVTQNSKNVYKPFIRDILTFDTIIECHKSLMERPLHIRPRREGDTLLLHGVNRKLRKRQNEVGLPAALRDRLPLLCDGDTVLWAPFCGTRDDALAPVRDTTRYALSIVFEILPDRAQNYLEEPI